MRGDKKCDRKKKKLFLRSCSLKIWLAFFPSLFIVGIIIVNNGKKEFLFRARVAHIACYDKIDVCVWMRKKKWMCTILLYARSHVRFVAARARICQKCARRSPKTIFCGDQCVFFVSLSNAMIGWEIYVGDSIVTAARWKMTSNKKNTLILMAMVRVCVIAANARLNNIQKHSGVNRFITITRCEANRVE